ncbi:hypothetical protein DS832_07800 [Bombilactobacillus bombi]|uniref:Uncharacterized protein n=2 Tax=Bombilactobacillus bombi TaxID=1303590 RepID=A0A417Z4R5_9LACO|nr:hypothetical protein DS832_07800 [Bombilactobacillus bombi]
MITVLLKKEGNRDQGGINDLLIYKEISYMLTRPIDNKKHVTRYEKFWQFMVLGKDLPKDFGSDTLVPHEVCKLYFKKDNH